jgi:hypothetical protein
MKYNDRNIDLYKIKVIQEIFGNSGLFIKNREAKNQTNAVNDSEYYEEWSQDCFQPQSNWEIV